LDPLTKATLRTVPTPARELAPAAAQVQATHRRRVPWLAWGALLLIVALGAWLRFYKLEHPALWGDEVATWGRVTGTFGDLMGRLSKEGFVPGHYVAYWALGKVRPLDPWHMRLIPALAGAFMVPVGYFLARQLLPRGTSLIAALFFATSAFGMTYARDAKMYMHTWLFVALSVACLMHWLRTRRAWSLWGWIIAGAIASTLHATSLILLGIAPLFALTCWTLVRRPRWRDPAYFILGAALIGAFPAWYYLSYNQYIARTGIAPAPTAADGRVDENEVRWRNSGITWVEEFNKGIGPWELTLNSASSYMVGLQWPRESMDPRGFRPDGIPDWFLPLCVVVMSVLIGLMVIGALPWRHRTMSPVTTEPRGPPSCWPWWLVATWLGLWLVVPTYGIYYCRSFAEFSPPWEPLWVAHEAIGGRWYLLLPLIVALAAALDRLPRLAPWAALLTASCFGISIAVAAVLRGSYWLHGWGELLGDARLLWPIIALTPAVLWYYAGATPRDRIRKTGQLAIAVAVVFVACVGAYVFWRYMLVLHERKNPNVPWESIWMPRYLGIVYPAIIVATAALLMRLPTWPLRTAAVAAFVAVNLTQGLARIELDTEPPYAELAADIWATRTTARATTVAINLEGTPGGSRRDWARRNWIMDYYMYAVSEWDDSPPMRRTADVWRVVHYRVDVGPDQIRRGLERRAELNRVIIWEKFDAFAEIPEHDQVLDLFSDQLTRNSERLYRTRQFWTWRPGDIYRRREYLRIAPQQPVDDNATQALSRPVSRHIFTSPPTIAAMGRPVTSQP
jgi:hypothetical protein